MARIPEDLLQRIRQEVPIDRLAEARGVELKRHGADLLGLCPFHEDREPSLVITPAKNLWHCLGACQAGGTPIDWVMKAEGVSFRHAVEILRAEHFPTAPALVESGPGERKAAVPQRSTVVKLGSPVDLDADDRELLGQVIGYYHETLKQSPEALSYLEKRGLVHAEVVDRFQLGYANRTLGYRLPAMTRKAGHEVRTRLQRLGVLRDSGHEHLNGSLVIPILGEEGEALGAYGRKIRNDLRPGTPDHLYLPGPHRGVFNIQALRASKEVILCEALIDALTFWCAGFRNVTASYGVEGFTHDHLAAFKTYGTEHVLIAYDRDEAGDRAAEALARELTAQGIGCSRVFFPKGMDANEYALKVRPAEKALGLLLRTAAWMGNGKRPVTVSGEAPAAAGLMIPAATEPAAPPVAASEAVVPAAPIAGPLAAPLPVPADAPPALVSGAGPEPAATPAPPPGPPSSPPVARTCERLASLAAKEEKLSSTGTASPAPDLDELVTLLGDRRYRLRGLKKSLAWGVLKLNVLVTREGPEAEALFAPPSPLSGFFVDTLDLCSARQRAAFEKQAAHELGVPEETVKRDLGQLLRKAEDFQQEAIQRTLAPKVKPVALSEEETAEAMALLRDPRLLDRILRDFETIGLVGEDTNKLTAYMAAVSRKLESPLAVIVQSSSAAGKSALMEAVLAFVPEEEREKYSALTGQSLFYFGEGKSLRHKVLAIAEEEGAEKATYALKLLQSEGELSIASTGKDPQTGRLVTQEYRVEGPVMIFLTTTAIEIDEELLNRCLVLTVDESREQTQRIHRRQRESRSHAALWAEEEREDVRRRQQNAQRLLRPVHVINPYVGQLTFLDEKTRTRRDHAKYLALIDAIALLFQHQRLVHSETRRGKTKEWVEVVPADIVLANRLAGEVLGRSLDELPPQTRRLLLHLDEMVTEACTRHGLVRSDHRFTLRDVRRFTGWSHDQLWRHMQRLTTLEYLLVHRGGRGQSFVYELLYAGEGKDGRPFLPGLLDPTSLEGTTVTSAGDGATCAGEGTTLAGGFAAVSRPDRGPLAGGHNGSDAAAHAAFVDFLPSVAPQAPLGSPPPAPSYPRLVMRRAAGGL